MKRFIFLALIGFVHTTVLLQANNIVIVEKEINEATLPFIQDMAEFENEAKCYEIFLEVEPEWELRAIYGNDDAFWSLETETSFFNSPFGGFLAGDLPEDIFNISINDYDSWFWIDNPEEWFGNVIFISTDSPSSAETFEESQSNGFLSASLIGESLTKDGFDDPEQGTPDEAGLVLIGQVTTDGSFFGTFNFKFRKLNPDGTVYLPVTIVDIEGITFSVTTGSCPGDFDGNGSVATADLLGLLAEFGCLVGCYYDLNDDDEVDVSDLLGFLPLYGQTCD